MSVSAENTFTAVWSTSSFRIEGQTSARESLDFVHWFTEQTLWCEVIRIPLVLVFPEDFARNTVSGPSSLWCMQELRDLEGFHEARQLAGPDQKQPRNLQ